MTLHWWMHWFWITRTLLVVAALLLVPLATALPAWPATDLDTPGSASDSSGGAWSIPSGSDGDVDIDDGEDDGMLGPRVLSLEANPAEFQQRENAAADDSPKSLDDLVSPSEGLLSKDADIERTLLADYAPDDGDFADDTDVPEMKGTAEGQITSKLITTRDVQNIQALASNITGSDPIPSGQLNNSDSHSSTASQPHGAVRESKSFSSSVAPSDGKSVLPPVKPLKAETDHSDGITRERPVTPAVPASGSGSSTAAPSMTQGPDTHGEQVSSGVGTVNVSRSTSGETVSNYSQADDAIASDGGSSQQPVDVYVTASVEDVVEVEVTSSPADEDTVWTEYGASAAADVVDTGPLEEEEAPQPGLRSRTTEREAADEEEADAPVSRGRVAPAAQPGAVPMDAASITGIALGIVVFASLIGAVSFVMYRRRYLNKPQTLNDKCSNPDSSGYIDDSTLRENSEEMYSLDNDSFLNSLEAMTIQNYWTDNVKHTKL